MEKSLTTIDVAYMNNDLIESICEILAESQTREEPRIECTVENKCEENKPEEVIVENEDHLTLAESLAQKVSSLLNFIL